MKKIIKDLKSDLLNAVDSTYAEYSEPDEAFLKENIKGVFLLDSYDYTDLKDQILKSISFLFSENQVPQKEVVVKNVEAVILSWRYKNRSELGKY